MHAQHWYWVGSAASVAVAVIAGVAEWRRGRRERIDDVGWVPWRGLQVASLFAAAGFVVMALKSH